jgi:hypothetical protein
VTKEFYCNIKFTDHGITVINGLDYKGFVFDFVDGICVELADTKEEFIHILFTISAGLSVTNWSIN